MTNLTQQRKTIHKKSKKKKKKKKKTKRKKKKKKTKKKKKNKKKIKKKKKKKYNKDKDLKKLYQPRMPNHPLFQHSLMKQISDHPLQVLLVLSALNMLTPKTFSS